MGTTVVQWLERSATAQMPSVRIPPRVISFFTKNPTLIPLPMAVLQVLKKSVLSPLLKQP